MMISTKGRYALRVMVDLAQHSDGRLIPLAVIAERQNISEKYLENIVSGLAKNGLVKSTRGKNGGYSLTKSPREYTVAEIISASEGDLAPVSCLRDSNSCENAQNCPTIALWGNLQDVIYTYLNNISLEDLARGRVKRNK